MRIETITRELYKYAELSDSAKERARDWLREAMQGDAYFAEYLTEEFADTIAPAFGWTIGKARGSRAQKAIYWSGFSSQGDGACFDGTWYPSDVNAAKLAEYAPTDERLASLMADMVGIAARWPDDGGGATVRNTGHYSHSGCTSFSADIDDEALLGDLKCCSRSLMDWLYRSLEKEWEYQNSDAVIAETIDANGYEFTADGSIA